MIPALLSTVPCAFNYLLRRPATPLHAASTLSEDFIHISQKDPEAKTPAQANRDPTPAATTEYDPYNEVVYAAYRRSPSEHKTNVAVEIVSRVGMFAQGASCGETTGDGDWVKVPTERWEGDNRSGEGKCWR
ncbi:hypothetical protein MMC13_005241 [Lambiella insularis]|nr:hypothetical protein [Lambiella insularis]